MKNFPHYVLITLVINKKNTFYYSCEDCDHIINTRSLMKQKGERKMISKDEMRAIIREEIRREICAVAHHSSGDNKYDNENEYNEFAWKNHEDYDYLVRTNQYLNI